MIRAQQGARRQVKEELWRTNRTVSRGVRGHAAIGLTWLGGWPSRPPEPGSKPPATPRPPASKRHASYRVGSAASGSRHARTWPRPNARSGGSHQTRSASPTPGRPPAAGRPSTWTRRLQPAASAPRRVTGTASTSTSRGPTPRRSPTPSRPVRPPTGTPSSSAGRAAGTTSRRRCCWPKPTAPTAPSSRPRSRRPSRTPPRCTTALSGAGTSQRASKASRTPRRLRRGSWRTSARASPRRRPQLPRRLAGLGRAGRRPG